jgi:hypothetical protein
MNKRLLFYAAVALGVFSFTYGPGDSAGAPPAIKKESVKAKPEKTFLSIRTGTES